MTETMTTGVIRTYHDKEKTQLKEEYFVHNNKKEGIYKSYHDNGCELSLTDNFKRLAIVRRSKLYQ